MKRTQKNKKGFTFIELMFAIALFGVNFHLIYGQVSQSIRSIAMLKSRQKLYYQIQNHVRGQMMEPYELVLNSNIDLTLDLERYRAKQIVQIVQNGLKKVEIEVFDQKNSVKVLALHYLKADSTRREKL
ncbi:prepilin-type N-terminal cleavage/methylation domain-containing protein [bacterium]|nr:prepilin-type N-terminal cleavage/methylation domain-containing protein [bacterium]